MPIPVPREMVFYVEDYGGDGEDRDILLCWLPIESLQEMTERAENSVSKQILDDYPDGLDLEISRRQFELLREKYQLDIGAPASQFLVILTAMRASTKATMPEDIKFATVNGYFIDLLNLEEIEGAPAVGSISEAERILKKNPQLQEIIDDQLERLGDSVAFDMADARPWEEKILGSPEMTEGENFMAVFNRLHRR